MVSLVCFSTGCASSGINSSIAQSDEPDPLPEAEISELSNRIMGQVFACWDGVADLPFPDQLAVRMSVTLDSDGRVLDLRLLEPPQRPIGSRSMSIAIDRAMRAVRKCSPYLFPEADRPDQIYDVEVELSE